MLSNLEVVKAIERERLEEVRRRQLARLASFVRACREAPSALERILWFRRPSSQCC